MELIESQYEILIKELIKKWILKDQYRNFEKILCLLEENNIYYSDIVYDTWRLPVHTTYFGISVNIEVNSNFLKDLTKLVWDPSIKKEDQDIQSIHKTIER